MATGNLHEPRVFTKTHREDFNQGTPKHPYLTFNLGPGELQRLVVKIWSNDQGWCDDHLKTEDPYANSHTWFSLGVVEESTPAQVTQSELLEFQRNVRASTVVRCHTNQWTLGVPAEGDDSDVHAWLESLSYAEGSVIRVYPLARYPSWVNTVWKMEVLVYAKARHQSLSPEPHIGLNYEDDRNANGVRVVDIDETIHIMSSTMQLVSEDHSTQATILYDLENRLYDRYCRTGAMVDLEEAIRIAKQAVEATPEDHPDWARWLNNLGVTLGDRYSRTGAMVDLKEAIRIARQAVEATPEDHPNQAVWLNNLGGRLGDRYSRISAMTDLRESQKVYATALNSVGAVTSTRIFASRSLLSHQATLQDGLEAYHITQTAISLVPLSAPFSLQSADKQHLLSQAVGLASDAAAVALYVGQGPLPAIELLETGRGVIASSLQAALPPKQTNKSTPRFD